MDFDELDELEERLRQTKGADSGSDDCRGLGPSKRWLLLRPVNGLGNRLSAIVAASLLAKDLGRRLAVDWRCTPSCNCPWERLFLPPATTTLDGESNLRLITAELLEEEEDLLAGLRVLEHLHPSVDQDTTTRLVRERFPVMSPSHCGWACWLDLESPEWLRSPRLKQASEDELPMALQLPCTVLLSYAEFYPATSSDRQAAAAERGAALRGLRPSQAVLQRVLALPSSAVGVHVRRSDHEVARRRSPDSLFTEALDALCTEDCGERVFFLATDDEEVQRALQRRYGGRVAVLAKRTLDRTRPEGIQDALSDLLTLARCGHILGSCGSTFSSVAALLHGAALTVLDARPGQPSEPEAAYGAFAWQECF